MGIPLRKVLAEFPAKKQESIKAKATKYIKEYKDLAAFRKDLGITQEGVAALQGVKQVNISNLEKRNDMLISTLRNYVAALGGELEIRIRMPGDSVVSVNKLNEPEVAYRSSSRMKKTVRKRKKE
jgi:predicted transcriptional regulator